MGKSDTHFFHTSKDNFNCHFFQKTKISMWCAKTNTLYNVQLSLLFLVYNFDTK